MDTGMQLFHTLLILLCSLHAVSNQRTYKRACECDYTSNGKCAISLPLALEDSHKALNSMDKHEPEKLGMLETEFSQLSREITRLKSELSDTRQNLQVLQMDTSSVMSDLQSLRSNYGLCLKRGILRNVGRRVSSQWNSGTGASSVHVHSHSAWCPDPNNPLETFGTEDEGSVEPNTDYEWVQFDLGEGATPVLGIVTRGRPDFAQWVTSYRVQYTDQLPEGDDQAGWTTYTDVVGLDMIFEGNSDTNTPQVNILWQPIHARYIRIWPLTAEKNFCMRADVIGCIDS